MSFRLSRRSVLLGAGAALPALAVPAARAATPLVRAGRPVLTHGVQAGDVGTSAGTVWVRADRPSRMVVEVSTRPDFRTVRRVRGPVLTPEHDFTGKTVLPALPDGRDVYYRVRALDLTDSSLASYPEDGHFRTVPRSRRDVSFVWSGDLAGQGFGISPEHGGYQIFNAMAAVDPDFFLCNGDNIYADDPIEESLTLDDGTVWHNITTEGKSQVAQTLDGYRANYQYNLLDHNLRAFYANTAIVQQWDDHETHNNWYPGEILDDPNYTEKRTDVLKKYSSQAWHEYMPINPRYDAENRIYRVLHHGPLLDVFVLDMRWYRDANSPDKQRFNNGGILGYRQAEWLKRELAASTATWKIISNDMPLTEVVADGDTNFEAVAQGDSGRPLGRELQIADILAFLKREGIRNVVWLTTDVHYTAAHYFDPNKAAFSNFDPFWQFTSGPMHAGAFPFDATDTTFGARQVFVKAPAKGPASPATEYQFFGQVSIDAGSRVLRVRLRDNAGRVLWTTALDPHRR